MEIAPLDRLRALLELPDFADRESRRVASAVQTIGLYLCGAAVIWVFIVPFALPGQWVPLALTGLSMGLIGLAIWLARRGRPRRASWILIGSVWSVTTLSIVLGGLDSPAFSAYIIAIVTAGLLLGTRGAVGVAVASGAAGALVEAIESRALLPSHLLQQTGLTLWGVEVTLFAAAAGVVAIYLNRIRDAEREVAESREQLLQVQKMEALGRLAGGVAHDFNNLLTTIAGYGELALDALDPDHPAREDLLEIQLSAERASELTRRLLAFSRQSEFQRRVLDLNSVVREMQRLIERLVGEEVEVEVDLAEESDPIYADRSQIEQVVMNLVVNARDAMPEGGRLTISTRNLTLHESLQTHAGSLEPGPHVSIAIRDSGVGMDPEVIGRLFEPFFTTKEIGVGTGLGLSILFGIIEEHAGAVRVESRPGEGTLFEVIFPRTDICTEDPEHEAIQTIQLRGSETILVVEDELAVLTLAGLSLRRCGYRVLEASSGAEALELARSHQGHIDLLVTDVIMPGLRGPQLAAALKKTRPETVVLYVSGYAAHAFDGVEVGLGESFLQKPFTPTSLAERVRKLLDRAKEQTPLR